METAEPATRSATSRRRRRIALAITGTLLAGIGALWIERRPIAAHFIDERLAASGVPVRYTIADLEPGRQRLTGVVIGDPARPDLVADWIETETALGWDGPRLVGVHAGSVRVRGRLIDGRLSLGALDRLLLPKGSGGRFAWPALAVRLDDARLRLETPVGTVGAALVGHGRLDRDFAGRLALASDTVSTNGCRVDAARSLLRVRTRGDTLRLDGPIATTGARCRQVTATAPRGAIDATVALGEPRWQGTLQLAAASVAASGASLRNAGGSVRFDGSPQATSGTLSLTGEDARSRQASAARLAFTGHYAVAATATVDGTLVAGGARLADATLARIGRSRRVADGTPVAPLLAAAGDAAARAATSFGGTLDLAAAGGAGGGIRLTRAALGAASGANVRFAGTLDLAAGKGHGTLSLAGGGLPDVVASVVARSGGIEGSASVRPYAAAGASLALTPVAFATGANGWEAATTATLSGPIGDGRVDALVLPLAVRGSADGRVLIGERCTEITLDRLRLGGLAVGATRWQLCPGGEALVAVGKGGVGGGAMIADARIAGTLGGSPLQVAADKLRLDWRDRQVAGAGISATLGQDQGATRMAFSSLDGRVAEGAIGGTFAGGTGHIGTVPLALSDAQGRWTLAGAKLALTGEMTVADTAGGGRPCTPATDAVAAGMRFCPMTVRDLTLRLADGRIAAAGTLVEPRSGARVAGVTLAHDLASGAGTAELAVASLSFTDKLQPDALTPLTFGVVADVAGTIDGAGRIAWDRDGVTSSGRFATAGLDLAASFGPVQGIEGAIQFSDLLGLVTPPGQQLAIRSINPGVPVEHGTLRFHLEPDSRVAVEAARWPFAGGMLTLDPTVLDMSGRAERHLTFRLAGVAADRFLQQFDFKNLAATGTFDGVLPMVFDAEGGRIEGGNLTVRQGGGTIAYVGELGRKQLGFWGDLAFEALKSLRYRSLAITMNGPLAGEMVTGVRFAGVSQGDGAKSNFLIRRLQRLPFVFNVQIKAPFRGLVDTTNSFGDPRGLIRRNLPGLMQQQGGAVQPPASAPVR